MRAIVRGWRPKKESNSKTLKDAEDIFRSLKTTLEDCVFSLKEIALAEHEEDEIENVRIVAEVSIQVIEKREIQKPVIRPLNKEEEKKVRDWLKKQAGPEMKFSNVPSKGKAHGKKDDARTKKQKGKDVGKNRRKSRTSVDSNRVGW